MSTRASSTRWGGLNYGLRGVVHAICVEVEVEVEVSGFETISGDGIFTTIDIDGEVFVSLMTRYGLIWWLEWFADSIMSDEYVCGS